MVGQRDVYERLKIAVDAARMRSEPLGHILFDGPPGLGKTTFATCIPRELDVPLQIASGAALDGAEGPASVPHQRRGRLGPVHRRNPPPAQGRRRVHVPGDGGFPHRHHARRRRERPHDQPGAAAVHAHRRHDAERPALGAAARSVPSARAPGLLHARGAGRDRPPHARAAYRSTRPHRRDRPPQPRHAADGQQPPALGARLRDQQGRRARDHDVAHAALAMLGVDVLGLDGQDRKYLETILRVFHGGPVGVERSPTR